MNESKLEGRPLHVVLGAGQVGPHIAQQLIAQGCRVRMVKRSAFGSDTPVGAEPVRADVFDAASMARALAGATVVYHTASPAYTDWKRLLLPMTRAIRDASMRAGVHLVVLDNLYMYGRAPGGVMREDTPICPCSRKGELRAAAAAELIAARDRGDLALTIGRASDFFGPGSPLSAIFGAQFWSRAFAGKSVHAFGDPDQAHSYSYVEDVAKGLVTLGTDARARNGVWHLPVNPAESTRAVIGRAGRAIGRELDISRVPKWFLQVSGLFSPLLREVAEMTYQWEAPFVLDDSRFRAMFGVNAAPWDTALTNTAAWARATYTA